MSENQEEYVVEEELIDVATLEDWKVDKYVNEIKDNNKQVKRYEDIYNKRVEELRIQFETKRDQLLKRSHYLTTTLGEYARTQKMSETKTQKKLGLLSGDIIIKKPKQDFVKPEDKYNEILAAAYPELVKKEEVYKLNWKELKKKLVMQDGKIYDKEDGIELTNIVGIVEKDEETIIK